MIISCFKFNPDFSANAAFRGKEKSQLSTNTWKSMINGQTLISIFINQAHINHNFITIY